jgi:hypothetical protein
MLHRIINGVVINHSMGLMGDVTITYPPHIRLMILHHRVELLARGMGDFLFTIP